jgi:hypothetical protein
MPKPVVLTRYLYIRDEVELAFINAIVSKADFDEVIFWLSELYESGFREEVWSLIWRCFYDFYAVKNPRQESVYYRHYEEWRIDKNISHLIFVCKNLHIKSADPSVFLFRMKVEGDPLPKRVPITGRRPKWVSEYDPEAQPFLVSLDKNIHDNILYYFKTLPVEVLRENLARFFKEKYAVVIDYDKVDTVWNGTRYDRRHILMAIYHHLMLDEAEINNGKMFVSVDDDEVAYWRDVNTIEEDIPNYRVLHYKRDYSIPKMVGAFNLARYHIKQTDGFTELNKILWYHWEYFAYRCPLWRKRIIEHSGEAVDDKKRVGFSRYYDDDEQEAAESDDDSDDGIEADKKPTLGTKTPPQPASGAGAGAGTNEPTVIGINISGTGVTTQSTGEEPPIVIPIVGDGDDVSDPPSKTEGTKEVSASASASSASSDTSSEPDSPPTENDNIGVEELKKNIKLAREKNYKYCIETFYELYGYEPDEQTGETQDKVRGEGGSIEPSTLQGWLEVVFEKERLGGFTDSPSVRYEYIGLSM